MQGRSILVTAQAISLRLGASPLKTIASPGKTSIAEAASFSPEGWPAPRNRRSAEGRLHGAGEFAPFDGCAPSPATHDWSPVRAFGGYAAWADPGRIEHLAFGDKLALTPLSWERWVKLGCGNSCSMQAILTQSPGRRTTLRRSQVVPGCDRLHLLGSMKPEQRAKIAPHGVRR